MTGGYTVKLEAFHGPLDLLLSLIEKRKMHISDVSLAEITDDYLSYLEEANEVHIRHTAEFIVVASTLVLLKSRSLLPALKLNEDEEESIDELERQLKEYKHYRDLSKHIKDRFGKDMMWSRRAQNTITPVFSPTKEITRESLIEAIKRVLQALPKIENVPQVVVSKMVTLKEMLDSLAARLESAVSLSFKEWRKEKPEKTAVVVSFLALLELVKRGVITAEQEKHFEDIKMETTQTTTPKYY